MDGECIINNISQLQNIADYKKKVDYIHLEEINSELNVRNYLTFYGIVAGIYSEEMMKETASLLDDLQMKEILDKKINDLSCKERILVRCIAARLKKVELLLCIHILDNKTADEQAWLLNFLNKYFVQNSCMCILFEKDKQNVHKIIDDIIVIDDLLENRK